MNLPSGFFARGGHMYLPCDDGSNANATLNSHAFCVCLTYRKAFNHSR